MGQIRTALPVKMFVSVLTSLPELMPEVERQLIGILGVIDGRSEAFPFDQTSYYDEEMGAPLQRVFLTFKDLILPWEIASAKKKTNEIESRFACECTRVPRPVNLDPGYLDQAKIVLASTKDFSHRVIISEGIYAEVTMHFQGGEWRSWPWTFPDFRTGRYNSFFSDLRKQYRAQLQERG